MPVYHQKSGSCSCVRTCFLPEFFPYADSPAPLWDNRVVFLAKRCKCGSANWQRSRRYNIFEKLLGVVLRPYRCGSCGLRCFKLRGFTPEP